MQEIKIKVDVDTKSLQDLSTQLDKLSVSEQQRHEKWQHYNKKSQESIAEVTKSTEALKAQLNDVGRTIATGIVTDKIDKFEASIKKTNTTLQSHHETLNKYHNSLITTAKGFGGIAGLIDVFGKVLGLSKDQLELFSTAHMAFTSGARDFHHILGLNKTATEASTVATKVSTVATEGATAATEGATAATETSTVATEETTVATEGATVATELAAESMIAEAAATEGAAIATKGFTESLLESPLLPLIAVLLAAGALWETFKDKTEGAAKAIEEYGEADKKAAIDSEKLKEQLILLQIAIDTKTGLLTESQAKEKEITAKHGGEINNLQAKWQENRKAATKKFNEDHKDVDLVEFQRKRSQHLLEYKALESEYTLYEAELARIDKSFNDDKLTLDKVYAKELEKFRIETEKEEKENRAKALKELTELDRQARIKAMVVEKEQKLAEADKKYEDDVAKAKELFVKAKTNEKEQQRILDDLRAAWFKSTDDINTEFFISQQKKDEDEKKKALAREKEFTDAYEKALKDSQDREREESVNAAKEKDSNLISMQDALREAANNKIKENLLLNKTFKEQALLEQDKAQIESLKLAQDGSEKMRGLLLDSELKLKLDQAAADRNVIKGIEETTDTIIKAAEIRTQANISVIDHQEQVQKKGAEINKTLAKEGLANELAFEQKRTVELEKARIIEQKKLKKEKEFEILLNSIAKFTEQNPSTALSKGLALLAETKIAEAIFMEKGGILGMNNQTSTLSLFGASRRHASGKDILLHAEEGEGIIPKEKMNQWGLSSNQQFSNFLKNPLIERSFSNVNISDNTALISEIQALKEIVKNKKETDINFDNLGEMIISSVENGITEVQRKQLRKPRIG